MAMGEGSAVRNLVRRGKESICRDAPHPRTLQTLQTLRRLALPGSSDNEVARQPCRRQFPVARTRPCPPHLHWFQIARSIPRSARCPHSSQGNMMPLPVPEKFITFNTFTNFTTFATCARFKTPLEERPGKHVLLDAPPGPPAVTNREEGQPAITRS